MDIHMQSFYQFKNENLDLTLWSLGWFFPPTTPTLFRCFQCFFFILLHPKNIFTYNVGNYSHPHIKEKTSFDVPHMFFNFVIVQILSFVAKLYTPSTLNIDFIQWHTQLNVCAVKWITHDLINDFHFTFQAYALPHTWMVIC